jgi:hypothetical protein
MMTLSLLSRTDDDSLSQMMTLSLAQGACRLED